MENGTGRKHLDQLPNALKFQHGISGQLIPVRERNDGISNRMVRYLTKELQDEISNTSKENRIENPCKKRGSEFQRRRFGKD